MMLNNSPAIYVDGKMAERVYSDGEIVWRRNLFLDLIRRTEAEISNMLETRSITKVEQI